MEVRKLTDAERVARAYEQFMNAMIRQGKTRALPWPDGIGYDGPYPKEPRAGAQLETPRRKMCPKCQVGSAWVVLFESAVSKTGWGATCLKCGHRWEVRRLVQEVNGETWHGLRARTRAVTPAKRNRKGWREHLYDRRT